MPRQAILRFDEKKRKEKETLWLAGEMLLPAPAERDSADDYEKENHNKMINMACAKIVTFSRVTFAPIKASSSFFLFLIRDSYTAREIRCRILEVMCGKFCACNVYSFDRCI